MRIIRRAASQITTRRKKLAVGVLVALAGSGGLAARAWQDGAVQGSASGASEATRLLPGATGTRWAQADRDYGPVAVQSAGPGVATSTRRFPTQSSPTQNSRVSGWVSPSSRSNASSFFSSTQSRESAEIDAKIRELINKIRRKPGDPAELGQELGQELEKLLAKQFDLRHAAQTQQVEKMKMSLAEAEETLAKRDENRDQIIERRAQQLLGQSDPLGWEYRLQTGGDRLDSSLTPPVTYGTRWPVENRYGVPVAPQSPSSSMVPRAMTPQAPVPLGLPAQSAPGAIQSSPRFSGAASGGDESEALVMKAQLDAAKENLRRLELLHDRKAVSASELAAAKSQMLIVEAKLKGSRDRLKLECETARIDLAAEMEELGLLKQESKQVKEGSSEAYNLLRLLSRSTASLRKAELQLDQKMQQLEDLSKIAKALEEERTAESEASNFAPRPEEPTDPEATP